jgi:hypothetical protein
MEALFLLVGADAILGRRSRTVQAIGRGYWPPGHGGSRFTTISIACATHTQLSSFPKDGTVTRHFLQGMGDRTYQ